MNEENMIEGVEHPEHYEFPGGVEVIDIARHLNFNRGNVVKYAARAGEKMEPGLTKKQVTLKDLNKAMEYLKDEIDRVTKYE